MSDREIALEALSALCNFNFTSLQVHGGRRAGLSSTITTSNFIPTFFGGSSTQPHKTLGHIIDEQEFFDPDYNYDFTDLEDTETYYRGGEVYERPCGWKRFALKVLDKYPDGNAWLGDRGHCTGTKSKSGEWPVSYHGTSKQGARGIIVAHYKPGSGEVYGRGIYSTPYISEAEPYITTFFSNSTGKRYQVLLQNRINPEYREKHRDGKYWLVPIKKGLSETEEQEIVEKAIRPYAILIKRV